MKKVRKINKIPVVAISTFGHSGIDWLHSLIDSHKEVLIIPPLSFFRKINLLKKKGINIDNSLNPRTITNIFMKEFDKAWVHGFLHLVGYDHIKDKDYIKMNKIEKRILNLI